VSINSSEKTFADFILVINKEKILVKGRLKYSIVENIGINFFALILPLFIYYSPPLHFLPQIIFTFVKLLLMVIAFIIVKKIIVRFLAIKLFEISKENKELRFNLEEFTIRLSEIQTMTIEEETYEKDNKEMMMYKIKFVLLEGEKTSTFAFLSFNKAQKIIDIIKNTS
jgi:hypothetical protein